MADMTYANPAFFITICCLKSITYDNCGVPTECRTYPDFCAGFGCLFETTESLGCSFMLSKIIFASRLKLSAAGRLVLMTLILVVMA